MESSSGIKTEIKKGLRPTPKDKRDISFGAVFSLSKLEELPKEFSIGESEILDQQDTDYCSGYATCAASAFQELKTLHPVWSFAVSKMISGDIDDWGQNLRDALKAHTKFGAIPITLFEVNFDSKYRDIKNFPDFFDTAVYHKKQSYFKVDSGNVFDDIRLALYANREEKWAVITGVLWRTSWLYAPSGIIPKLILDNSGFGHAFIITGWKEIAGEPYLVAQLSNGTDIGDKGKFYFPRQVVNREFTYGAYTFKDISSEEAKKRGWNVWIKILNFLQEWNIFKIWRIGK